MIKPILDQPILPEEINDSYNKLQTVKDKCIMCGKDITYTIKDFKYKKFCQYCEACRQELLFTKKSSVPLEVDETSNLNGYNKKTEVTFKCKKCGVTVVKRLSALEASGFFCRECATLNSYKKKYGTENPFATDAIKNKIVQTKIERYGSLSHMRNKEFLKQKIHYKIILVSQMYFSSIQ